MNEKESLRKKYKQKKQNWNYRTENTIFVIEFTGCTQKHNGEDRGKTNLS
jgi:hypothetical protein